MTYTEGEEITVTGVVRADDSIAAPLTGEYCIVHVTHARVWDRLDLAGNLVEEILVGRLYPFVLETGGEPIRVSAEAFSVEIKRVDVYPTQIAADALLRARGLERYVRSTFFDHVLVRAGEQITVRGVVAHDIEREGEHGYRDTAVRMRLVGYPGHPLTISR